MSSASSSVDKRQPYMLWLDPKLKIRYDIAKAKHKVTGKDMASLMHSEFKRIIDKIEGVESEVKSLSKDTSKRSDNTDSNAIGSSIPYNSKEKKVEVERGEIPMVGIPSTIFGYEVS